MSNIILALKQPHFIKKMPVLKYLHNLMFYVTMISKSIDEMDLRLKASDIQIQY
jgi:hypothetical protein